MSVEDKIRRAEEIYYRRKNKEIPARDTTTKAPIKKKRNIKLLNKMIKQILICLVIYSIFYAIINNNYIFSEDFTKKAREILNQDINFSQIYANFLEILKQDNSTTETNQSTENVEQTIEPEKTKEEIQNNEENIGGAEIVEIPVLSQMEQDANYIKNTINFIKPIEGTITSMFGLRNPTTSSVPKNHTGTDIAAETGAKIISATDGIVIYKSTKGDYGKHLKIQVNDVIVLYAHCNKLYVEEGEIIKQGQEIAEVGSTGNTTGPHLHFEIRYQDRCVDPQLILQF